MTVLESLSPPPGPNQVAERKFEKNLFGVTALELFQVNPHPRQVPSAAELLRNHVELLNIMGVIQNGIVESVRAGTTARMRTHLLGVGTIGAKILTDLERRTDAVKWIAGGMRTDAGRRTGGRRRIDAG